MANRGQLPQAKASAARRRQRAYVSDFTRFIDGYLADHPEVVSDQQRGRAIYWDKRVDIAELMPDPADVVPTDAYYYFGNPWPRGGRTAGGKAAK